MHDSSEVRKAAILLMSLPKPQAAALMSRLNPKQVEAVSIVIAKLGNVPNDEQERVINEFADTNPKGAGRAGGLDFVQALVSEALGNEATKTLDNVFASVRSVPFGFLKKIDPQNIQSFIAEEHPQTIALILSHLPPHYGAEIISGLPSDKQLSVIRRVARMGQTSPEVIAEVERGLESRMSNFMTQSFDNAGGVGNVAEILNVTDRATERALLDRLSEDDAELVDEIRRLMFVFEDITKLGDKDVQALLKNVESTQWAMALKGASDELREKVLGNMSQRASQMLMEEMEFLGAKKLSEVESVQQQIVDIVRRLEDTGEISTGEAEEGEEFVQ